MKALLAMLICFFLLTAELAAQEIKIGVVYPFTGAGAAWADYGRMGLELAAEEVEREGGIAGRPLQLVFEDSQTQPAKGVSAYRKLVSRDKVKIVIGDVWSYLTNPLIPLAEKDRVLLLSPTVMDESVEKVSPYFYSMGHSVGSIEDAVDKFFKINTDIKRIGILCWEELWSQANLRVWRRVAAANQVAVVEEILVNDFSSSFASEVTKLAASKVDGVIVASQSDVALARMSEQNIRVKVLTTADMVDALTVRKVDPKLVEGVYFTNWSPGQKFIDNFQARFGKQPIAEAYNHYESLRSLAKALRMNADDPAAALKLVNYEGVAGRVDFTHGNFPNAAKARLYQVRNGRIVSVD